MRLEGFMEVVFNILYPGVYFDEYNCDDSLQARLTEGVGHCVSSGIKTRIQKPSLWSFPALVG